MKRKMTMTKKTEAASDMTLSNKEVVVKTITKVCNEYCLIEILSDAVLEQTQGGIFVHRDHNGRRCQVARIVMNGPGRQIATGVNIVPVAEPGEAVLVSRQIGERVMYKGREHLMVKLHDILAVVDLQ
jgi:co-chaperonin GroES (HSP10)